MVRDVERPRPTRTRAGCPLATNASDPDHRVARHWRPRLVSALGEPQLSLGDLAPQQNQLQVDFVGLGFGSGEVLRYRATCWRGPTRTGAPQTSTARSRTPALHRVDRFTVRAVKLGRDRQRTSCRYRLHDPLPTGFAGGPWRSSPPPPGRSPTRGTGTRGTAAGVGLHPDSDCYRSPRRRGANLTRIAVLAEVASHTHDVGPLASIARIARESVSSMSDIVWAINPKRDSLIDLTRRMRQHADELFTLRDIELRFSAPAAPTISE